SREWERRQLKIRTAALHLYPPASGGPRLQPLLRHAVRGALLVRVLEADRIDRLPARPRAACSVGRCSSAQLLARHVIEAEHVVRGGGRAAEVGQRDGAAARPPPLELPVPELETALLRGGGLTAAHGGRSASERRGRR